MMRWTAGRKVELLAKLATGEIDLAGVAALGVTREELAQWQARYKAYGKDGLKTTRAQEFRMTRRLTRAPRRDDG